MANAWRASKLTLRTKQPKPKTCAVCKTSFTPQRMDAKVCSPICGMESGRQDVAAKAPTELVFGWPPKELSPNARVHWRKKSPITKAYKAACWALALESGITAPVTEGRLHLWITFYPPDRRHRDDDNMIASFKAGRDGLALALGVDDKRFVTHPFVSDQIGGLVKVRITAGPEA